MNPFRNGGGIKTKWIAWKAKMDGLARASGAAPRDQEPPAARALPMKSIDRGFTNRRGRYVLRPRLSWTGLYGKAPWPRERKQWEKV
jgi:hypothetical protein